MRQRDAIDPKGNGNMTTDVHDIGDLCRLITTFKDSAGTVTDPTGVTFSVKAPSGTVTTYVYGVDGQLGKTSTGVYYVDFTPAQSGRHIYRWVATGAIVTSESNDLYVRRNEAIA